MQIEDVRWLHVELSSKCNAWCPGCPRNKNGYGLADSIVEQDLSLEKLEYRLKQFPNLETVQLCGNFGDPMVAGNIIESIDLIKQYAKRIQIHTNGSMRNKEWWAELAIRLQDINHDIWFGIDGLKGVHEIYRQGTDFDKVIENATAFINNGGSAVWQFIPFKHNLHQVKDCIRLSQQLKFKRFVPANYIRNKQIARHYRTGEEFVLEPANEIKNPQIKIYSPNKIPTDYDCMHLNYPSVYIGADGTVSNCCFFGSTDIKFDNLEEMFYNKKVLNSVLCNTWCGK